MEAKQPLLKVDDLHVSFFTPVGEVKAVNGISYELDHGEVMGIVGESGSGKSVEAYSIMGLLQPPGRVVEGSITFDGQDVLAMSKKEKREFRGTQVSMIFQNPMTCLNPVYTIGKQLSEALLVHKKMKKEEALAQVKEILTLVGINNVDERVNQYPHELSGGMRQRVMIAMGLICRPKVLIADEPTTALDVTIQAQILSLMKGLQREYHTAIMFITHDLGVVAETADRVVVMYAGQVVEEADVMTLFHHPAHPYTQGLLNSTIRVHELSDRLETIDGVVPTLTHMPEGCRFAPRCPHATEACRKQCPSLKAVGDQEGHMARCILSGGERK